MAMRHYVSLASKKNMFAPLSPLGYSSHMLLARRTLNTARYGKWSTTSLFYIWQWVKNGISLKMAR